MLAAFGRLRPFKRPPIPHLEYCMCRPPALGHFNLAGLLYFTYCLRVHVGCLWPPTAFQTAAYTLLGIPYVPAASPRTFLPCWPSLFYNVAANGRQLLHVFCRLLMAAWAFEYDLPAILFLGHCYPLIFTSHCVSYVVPWSLSFIILFALYRPVFTIIKYYPTV